MKRGNRKIMALLLTLMSVISVSAQTWTQFPSSFRHTRKNTLQSGELLDSVFMLAADTASAGIKIMHIGDSHVRGKAFPQALEATLKGSIPHLGFAFYGINGAWAKRFSESDMILKVADEKPNLVIISFGTNESHAPAYNEAEHTKDLMNLVCRIEANCPDVKIILTTPPGSYLAVRSGTKRGRRGKRVATYSHERNERTQRVAANIVKFAKDNRIAYWDLYSMAGGDLYACTNWREANLMNTDYIHYTTAGYNLMGQLLGEAILKVYFERSAY